MAKITEKQLISAIKELKEIKPRKEWAVLFKSTLLDNRVSNRISGQIPAQKIGNWEIEKFIENWKLKIGNSFARRLAYSFATLLFIMVGIFGFAQSTLPGDVLFPIRRISEQSQAALAGANSLQNNIAVYDKRVQDLVSAVKNDRKANIPSAISEVKQSMTEAVKSIADAVKQEDGKSIKDIAADVKRIQEGQKKLQTLGLDIGGADDSADELNNILEPLVQGEIADLEKSTLTEDQQKTLQEIKELYDKADYAGALEQILMINN